MEFFFYNIPYKLYISTIFRPFLMKQVKLCLFILISTQAFSQQFLRPQDWKKYKKEIYFSTGTSNFLGDLGGRPRDGSDYSPADLNFNQSRTAFGVGFRYRLTKIFNVSGNFDYLIVKGDDANIKIDPNDPTTQFRYKRNLNFKSNIFELSARVEAGLQKTKKGGGHYGMQRNYGKYKNINQGVFGFIGIGVFYFNPKGKATVRNAAGISNQSNDYIALRPLHTEGQGLPGGPKQYSRVSVSIPIGVYYKLTIKKKWSFGAELCFRKTFTDYIDDVGGNYYDPVALRSAYGDRTVAMADPYIPSTIPGDYEPPYDPKLQQWGAHATVDGVAAKRGDKQKDSFISFQVKVGYIFKKTKKSARLRSKF
jgi:hypothetical protein